MNQFGKIFSFELKHYLRNKIFMGVTVFLVALIAVIMFFPRISSLFGGDESPAEKQVMLVKASDMGMNVVVQQFFAASFESYDVQITDESDEAIRQQIMAGEVDCAFVLTDMTGFIYYVNNLSMYDTNSVVASDVLKRLYQFDAMVSGGMTAEQASQVMNIAVEARVENLGVDQMQNYWYTYIMIFALYMVIVLYGQMVATNVATEKSSRAMELLITSAEPTSMMFGKVLASCLAGLMQIVAIFGSSILSYTLNKEYWADNMIIGSVFNMPPVLFGYMLVFFVLGFLIYGFLYGAIGSTASKLEDINTSVMPITMLFMVSFMVVIFSLTSAEVDNTVMKVCSFIPFTSSMAMFTRIAMSAVPAYEILVSVGILVISVVGIGILSAKIYRIGVLMYGTPPKISQLLKMIKKA